ncbi:MAG: class I SAM-dependent methyltransferase [Planctomycetes bacterium]|nr:class I SAM-dependent methyltransferase [Planctomycetota bacterium]
MTAPSADAGALYETLSRFQWWRSRRARSRGEGLELRKRLSPPRAGDGPADGAAGLDRWLFAQLAGRPAARVLDLGCGFGASTQRWAALGGGTAVGITPSAFQVDKATAAAARAGLGSRVRFVRQDFLAPLDGRFDVVLAIESLGHAHDLPAALANVRRALRPGGTFVWVEDLLRAPLADDADVHRLAAAWRSPPLRTIDDARQALRAADLAVRAERDLTHQVPVAAMPQLAARDRRLGRVRRLSPLSPLRRLIDAFRGGVALERLYVRQLACYLVWMSERPPEAS